MNLIFYLNLQVISIVIWNQKCKFLSKVIELIDAHTKPFTEIADVLNSSRLEDFAQVLKIMNHIQYLALHHLPLLYAWLLFRVDEVRRQLLCDLNWLLKSWANFILQLLALWL